MWSMRFQGSPNQIITGKINECRSHQNSCILYVLTFKWSHCPCNWHNQLLHKKLLSEISSSHISSIDQACIVTTTRPYPLHHIQHFSVHPPFGISKCIQGLFMRHQTRNKVICQLHENKTIVMAWLKLNNMPLDKESQPAYFGPRHKFQLTGKIKCHLLAQEASLYKHFSYKKKCHTVK